MNGHPIRKTTNGNLPGHHCPGDTPGMSRLSSAPSRPDLYPPIRAIYVSCDEPFPEVESFVDDSIRRYNLDLVRIGGGMKEALTSYLGPTSGTKLCAAPSPGHGVRAMLIGTRRGDPHGGTHIFDTNVVSQNPFLNPDSFSQREIGFRNPYRFGLAETAQGTPNNKLVLSRCVEVSAQV